MPSIFATKSLICSLKQAVEETQELYEVFVIELARIWTEPILTAIIGPMDLDDLPDLIDEL